MVCSDSWDCMENVRASVFVDVNIHSASVACVANFIKMRGFSLPADCRSKVFRLLAREYLEFRSRFFIHQV